MRCRCYASARCSRSADFQPANFVFQKREPKPPARCRRYKRAFADCHPERNGRMVSRPALAGRAAMKSKDLWFGVRPEEQLQIPRLRAGQAGPPLGMTALWWAARRQESAPGTPDPPGSTDLPSAPHRGLGSPSLRRPGGPVLRAPTEETAAARWFRRGIAPLCPAKFLGAIRFIRLGCGMSFTDGWQGSQIQDVGLGEAGALRLRSLRLRSGRAGLPQSNSPLPRRWGSL